MVIVPSKHHNKIRLQLHKYKYLFAHIHLKSLYLCTRDHLQKIFLQNK
jgi:hypothetical protein